MRSLVRLACKSLSEFVDCTQRRLTLTIDDSKRLRDSCRHRGPDAVEQRRWNGVSVLRAVNCFDTLSGVVTSDNAGSIDTLANGVPLAS